jgi:membrane protein
MTGKRGDVRSRLLAARTWATPLVERVDESVLGHWYSRLLEIEFVDRSVALAAKLFVAFFPFVLGVASLMPDSVRRSIIASLTDRFGLGSETEIVAGAFASTTQTRAATGLLGAVLLFFYATSFTTALQRVYLKAWRRPPGGGVRNQGRGLAWLGGTIAFFAINGFIARVLSGGPGTVLRTAIGLVGATGVWWWTAHTMLRGDVRWRALLPGAVLTSAAMTGYVLSSGLWMPASVQNNSAQFGFFGVSLALVSWFVGACFVIIVSAALCPVLVEGDHALARWLRAGGEDALVPGAPAGLPGPTRRLRLLDAIAVHQDGATGRSD